MLWKFATPMSVNEPYTAAVLTFPEKKRVKKCLCENFPKNRSKTECLHTAIL